MFFCAKMSAQVAVSRACLGSLVGAVDPFVRGLKARGGKNCIARVRTGSNSESCKQGAQRSLWELCKLAKAHRGTTLLVRNRCGIIC